MMRLAITGYPKAGKSTLAERLAKKFGIPHYATDSLIGVLDWSPLSEEVSKWFDRPGNWIIEGVAVPRALRKWRLRNPDKAPPLDQYLLLDYASPELSKGQRSMGTGVMTVHRELEPWLGALVRHVPRLDLSEATSTPAPEAPALR